MNSIKDQVAEDYHYWDFETAIEILGQSKAPFVVAYWKEKAKDQPNEALLKYIEAREDAIDNLMDDLDPEDKELIALILDSHNPLFRDQ